MPLVKTSKLLKDLKLARQSLADPTATAYLLSSEGLSDALKAGRLDNPIVGLWLWAIAYQDPYLTKAICEMGLAMNRLHKAFTDLPPATWEGKLRDKTRSVEGYSIDTLYLGNAIPIDPEAARTLITERLAAKRKPKAKPAPKLPAIAGRNAWIKPNGKFIPVPFEGHIGWCYENDTTDSKCEATGWIKISSSRITLFSEPAKKQLNTLFDWCEYHKLDYRRIEKVINDSDRMSVGICYVDWN